MPGRAHISYNEATCFLLQSKYDLDSKFPFQKPKIQTPQLSLKVPAFEGHSLHPVRFDFGSLLLKMFLSLPFKGMLLGSQSKLSRKMSQKFIYWLFWIFLVNIFMTSVWFRSSPATWMSQSPLLSFYRTINSLNA